VEVLGFVARRLYADRVGMLFSVREGEEPVAALADLPELMVDGLEDEVAHELLATSAGARVDGQVSRQIVAGTAGNPLALVELVGELTAAELSGRVTPARQPRSMLCVRLAQDQVRELAQLPVRVGRAKALFDGEQGGQLTRV
jgi:hypothetical protein